MFLHVCNSWLLAQLLHPLLFILSGYFWSGEPLPLAAFIIIFVFSSIVSMPSLFLGWLFLSIIVYSEYVIPLKFIFWLLTSAALILLTIWILILVIGGLEEEMLRNFLYAIPGIISIWVVSIIRYRKFRKLVDESVYKKNILLDKNESIHEN